MKRIAVLAHYDIDAVVDTYLDKLITELENFVDKIILVTTSGVDDLSLAKFKKIQVIQRNNVGYDFYSYKVGIDSIADLQQYDQLLILNDSFYTTEYFDLNLFLRQSKDKDIYSITSTNQFAYHLQSYFIVFNKKAILSIWFYKFWQNVFIYKRKIKIIFDYEINLTRSAMQHGLTAGSMFFSQDTGNPCHNRPDLLLEKVGIIKIDLLRNKIADLDYSCLKEASIIDSHLNRTRESYKDRVLNGSDVEVTAGNGFFEYSKESLECSRIAVMVHLFYVDLIDEIKESIEIIPYDFDLFITVTEEVFLPVVINKFSGQCNRLYIAVVKNRGRDVLPFVQLMKNFDFRHYEIALKLHTKKSKYSSLGDKWRGNILKNLLPSGSVISKLYKGFIDNNIGIAANFSDYLSNDNYWGANKIRYNYYCELLDIPLENRNLFFIGGTMFWFNPNALYPIVNLMTEDDFEEELNQQDGTLAHVFERLSCKSVAHAGMRHVDINELNDVTSNQVIHNDVIVLQ